MNAEPLPGKIPVIGTQDDSPRDLAIMGLKGFDGCNNKRWMDWKMRCQWERENDLKLIAAKPKPK